jgi:hypothetical protein
LRNLTLRAITVAAALTVSTLPVVAANATTAPAEISTVTTITDRVAHALTVELADPASRTAARRLDSLSALDPATLDAHGRLAGTLATANAELLTAKGLPAGSARLLQVRLGHRTMIDALRRGDTPLVAATPSDDHAATLTGYEPNGQLVSLPTNVIPTRPVIMVDLDVTTAARIGMQVFRQETATRGLTAPMTATAGFWATQITRVRVHDVQEPWFKGAAEIFSLVTGFDVDGKVRVDPVDMPYLDDADHDYYPNQLLVYWNRYRYNAADVVMMEDDGDTNYSALATAIATALLTIVDSGSYIPLVTAVLNAIPTSWWTDDPDYVESWYTLTTGVSGSLHGAAGNGTMDVRPFFVSEL